MAPGSEDLQQEQPDSSSETFERWLPLCRLAAFILVAFVMLGAILTATRGAKGDIDVFIHAARLVLEGKNIYDIPNQLGIYYLYPPLFAIINIPLTLIPIDLAIVIWCVVTVVLLGWSIAVFYRAMTGVSFFAIPSKTRWTIGVFSVLLVERFIETHLVLSQANALILAASVAGLYLWSREKNAPSGLALGISLIIKPLTYPFGILFLARRDFRVLISMIVGALGGVLLPALVFGFERNLQYHMEWFEKVILKHQPGYAGWVDTFNLSLQAQLFRFFTDIPSFYHGTSQYAFTIWRAPSGILTVANWILLLTVPLLIILFAIRFRNSAPLVSKWGSVAFVFSLIPLSSTVAQEHHFVLLLPACVYVVYLWAERGLDERWFRGLVIGFFVLTELTTRKIWGVFLSEVFIALGCMTFGTLLLSLAIVRGGLCIEKKDQRARLSEGDH